MLNKHRIARRRKRGVTYVNRLQLTTSIRPLLNFAVRQVCNSFCHLRETFRLWLKIRNIFIETCVNFNPHISQGTLYIWKIHQWSRRLILTEIWVKSRSVFDAFIIFTHQWRCFTGAIFVSTTGSFIHIRARLSLQKIIGKWYARATATDFMFWLTLAISGGVAWSATHL